MANKETSASNVIACLWDCICDLVALIEAIIYDLVLIICAVVCLLMLLTSFVWFPLYMWIKPGKAAEHIAKTRETEKNDSGELALYNKFFNLAYHKPMFKFWQFVAMHRLPMSKKRYFIDVSGKKLEEYPIETQLEYLYVPENYNKETLKNLSWDAIYAIWDTKDREKRKLCLESCVASKEWAKDLLEQDNDLLLWFCHNGNISAEMQKYLAESIKQDIAYNALLDDSNEETLDDQALELLIGDLSNINLFERAATILSTYAKKKSIKDELLKKLVTIAADNNNPGHDEAFKIFIALVQRDGVTQSTLEEVFKTKNQKLIDKVKDLVDDATDKAEVVCHPDRWTKYCALVSDICDEAQVMMDEEHFDIFIQSGKKLSENAARVLLKNRISENDRDYFKKVLLYALEHKYLDENLATILFNTEWKRAISIEVESEHPQDK